MNIPITVSLTLFRGEILILAALRPGTKKNRTILQLELNKSRDVDNFNQLLHGLLRLGLVLERPALLYSEFMLSERGQQMHSQISQCYRRETIVQVETPP